MDITTPIHIGSSIVLKNRICKSAMSESLADKNNNPTAKIITLYRRWADSGAGLLITGNVMLSGNAIGEPKNVVLDDTSDLSVFKAWADAAQQNDTKCFMQLNHPGRQIPSFLSFTPVAPSAVPLTGAMRTAFNKPRALSEIEILDIIAKFARSAGLAQAAGFSGVQIHGAHGYLVDQFLSPLTNVRQDQWGGSQENRLRFVLEVYRAIRARVGNEFPVAIKLTSCDLQAGGITQEDSIITAKALAAEGIDLIEISGGNYETQSMSADAEKSGGKGFFVDYARRLKREVTTPIMVTGGLRDAYFVNNAISNVEFDLAGFSRPFALYPELGKQLIEQRNTPNSPPVVTPYIKTGIGMLDRILLINITWYEEQIALISKGLSPNLAMSAWSSAIATIKATGIKGLRRRRA